MFTTEPVQTTKLHCEVQKDDMILQLQTGKLGFDEI